MILAVEKKINAPLNVGSGSGVTIKEMVETIVANIPNKKLKITFVPALPNAWDWVLRCVINGILNSSTAASLAGVRMDH